ncbi:PREDICTED: receptor-type tyrosine-protein kinase FLT3-like isoform X2 [Papilio polytes]|uniref:receptor-type tyrosine-protein kinase FLT3-like isoform X2 n=1 Tax=Papilio polytes TaxID=76194 RepID=UPI0006766BF6|nr:PREDICTED: receptor-type tyrosine-protein kinase FLT3-like isoform X2 [Papilio polytes]
MYVHIYFLTSLQNETTYSYCQKKFLRPYRKLTTSVPPTLTVRCQSKDSVTFMRRSQEGWQLVVLVPHEEDFERAVSFTILESTDTIGQLSTAPSRNYTLWTTLLASDGSPLLWLRGPDVYVWASPPHVDYDVKTKMLLRQYKNGTRYIPAEFTWNAIDESDSCFNFVNKCNKDIQGDFFSDSIPPDGNRSVVIDKLPLDDICVLMLTGKYGQTLVKYRTPECYDILGCVPLPEKFSDVSTKVTEMYGNWRVLVSWKRPRLTPLYYNASLYADIMYSVIVPGNATEVIFDDVSGEGQYIVGLAATTASGTVHTSRTGYFPILEKISNLSMEIGEAESGWRVRVRWARPRTAPLQYNATLYADTVYNMVVPGNNTEVIFDEVYGEGLFNISLMSTSTTGTAYTSSEGYFPSEKSSNMTVKVSEGENGGWRVRASWPRAAHSPDLYNATLYADSIYTIIIPGNSTEAVFDEVFSEGAFNVTLSSTSGKQLFVNQQGYLPRVAHPVSVGVAVCAAWLSALLFVVAVSALLYLNKRRSDKDKFEYFQDLKDKLYKEVVPEVAPEAGAEAGAEVEAEAGGDRWEVSAARLALHELVGEGAFGRVRRATLAPATQVAVKMLKEYPTAEELRSFRAEMELMKSVGSHAHVVSLLGCCSGRTPLIVVEYCSRGDLLTFLRNSWDVMITKRNARYYNTKDNLEHLTSLFKEEDCDQSKAVVNKLYDLQDVCDELTFLDLLSFCRQIAMGMEFLASNRVVHRDLAARNVLVTGDKTLKIADFGLSRDVYQQNLYKQKGNGKLPIKWMALESLTHRIFTTHSDVWSFGVVMWEVLSVGGAPYPAVAAARLPRLLRAGYRMPRPANCTPQLYEVIMGCWRVRPNERPTFAQLRERLDALLSAAASDHYLTLDLPADPPSPAAPHTAPPPHNTLLLNGKEEWERSLKYERPSALSNRYTSPPVTQTA